MKDRPQARAIRSLRILYPIWVMVGIFSIMYVPSTLIDYGDALATTSNISEQTLLFRLGIAGSLITQLLYIIIPLLLYRLFESLDKNVAISMVVLALISVPITMFNEANKLFMLDILDEPDRVLETLGIYSDGLTISIIFWGLWLFPLGWLVYRSQYFPKLIGVALLIAGIGYTLGSFTEIIFPDSSALLSIFETMTIGEMIFILWLVIVGTRWKKNKPVEA